MRTAVSCACSKLPQPVLEERETGEQRNAKTRDRGQFEELAKEKVIGKMTIGIDLG